MQVLNCIDASARLTLQSEDCHCSVMDTVRPSTSSNFAIVLLDRCVMARSVDHGPALAEVEARIRSNMCLAFDDEGDAWVVIKYR